MRWVENRIFHGMYMHAEHNLNDLTKVVGEMEFQLDQWYPQHNPPLTIGTHQSPNQ